MARKPKQVFRVPRKQLHDLAVQYQVYLERVKAHELTTYDAALVKMDRALRAALSAVGDGALSDLSMRQLETLIARVAKEVSKGADAFIAELTGELKAINAYSTQYENKSLNVGLGAATSAKAISQVKAWQFAMDHPIEATGQLLSSFTEDWKASTLSKVEGVLRTGYAQGQTVGQVVTTLRGTRAANYMDGVLTGQARRQTQAMVRTAIQHVSAQAREAVWATNEDIVDGYIWVSTLDDRTTAICQSLDGRHFEVGKGPTPPIHINCRSVTVASLRGEDPLKGLTRASKGDEPGQVPADTTFFEWLKTQPADFQDDAIGPVRAQLLRKGGLSADEFAKLNLGRNFQPLTLAEMREKAPDAFKRAGL